MTDIVEVEEEKRGAGRPVGSYKKVKNKLDFVKEDHELDKAIKKTGKAVEEAVNILMDIARDKAVDPKERAKAASDVIKHHSSMVDQRNKDMLTRLIAQYRVGGLKGSGSIVEDDDSPVVDFNNMHPDFRENENIIEMEDDEENT